MAQSLQQRKYLRGFQLYVILIKLVTRAVLNILFVFCSGQLVNKIDYLYTKE